MKSNIHQRETKFDSLFVCQADFCTVSYFSWFICDFLLCSDSMWACCCVVMLPNKTSVRNKKMSSSFSLKEKVYLWPKHPICCPVAGCRMTSKHLHPTICLSVGWWFDSYSYDRNCVLKSSSCNNKIKVAGKNVPVWSLGGAIGAASNPASDQLTQYLTQRWV